MGKKAILVVLLALFSSMAASQEQGGSAVDLIAEGVLSRHLETQGEKILETIRSDMQSEKAIYSARLFANLATSSFMTQVNLLDDGTLAALVGGEFLDIEKRPPFEFQANLKEGFLESKPVRGLRAKFVVLVPNELFMVKFTQTNFKTPIRGYNKAHQALICAVAKQDGVTGHYCQLAPSSVVLGTIALDGAVNGPYYVGDRWVKKGKRMVIEPILVQEKVPKN